MAAAALLAAVSQILLKMSAGKTHKNEIMEYLNIYVISGYAMLFLSMLLNFVAYKYIEYRFGPVINALSYVFVLFLGNLFLKEKITARKFWGNILIIIGIIISVSGS